MSGRGIDFPENWVNKNVTSADRKGSRDRAKELAAQCIADAADLGITIDDMEPEWGSVEEINFDTMQAKFQYFKSSGVWMFSDHEMMTAPTEEALKLQRSGRQAVA